MTDTENGRPRIPTTDTKTPGAIERSDLRLRVPLLVGKFPIGHPGREGRVSSLGFFPVALVVYRSKNSISQQVDRFSMSVLSAVDRHRRDVPLLVPSVRVRGNFPTILEFAADLGEESVHVNEALFFHASIRVVSY